MLKSIPNCWYERVRDGATFRIDSIYKENGRYEVAFSHANFIGSLGMSRSDFERVLNKGLYKVLGFHRQIVNKYGQKEDVYVPNN